MVGYDSSGLSIDVASRFFTADELLPLVHTMPDHELTSLRIYLIDDLDWRIGVPRGPEVTPRCRASTSASR
ncbi:family 20 glycosylhydrolase [Cutibacterium avidum]|uniref:family 20 glycosylhydrolase n=1 Tax=Cutibacterium avidum TaxID=33010 RepID=UPI00083E6E78|nr:family 20 glycosylhydrolase [Cutibacterium avidum]AOG28234.1 hypothetical protein BFS79_06585 [Cutibacterium avidum]